jgi:hypothetical protein
MPTLTLPALEICVTAEDIAQGKQYVSHSCPVALSLKRQGYCGINVWVDRLSFLDPNNDTFYHYSNPFDLADFIKNFDRKRDVQPASFYLDLSTCEGF